MNDYISIRFQSIRYGIPGVRRNDENLKICLDDVEVGYLAMHLERVMDTELK